MSVRLVKYQKSHHLVEHLGRQRFPLSARPIVLSYGGGVDSFFATVQTLTSDEPAWAAIRRDLASIVFCNLGDEKPGTYEHLHGVAIPFMQRHGWDLTILRPRVRDRFGNEHTQMSTYVEAQGWLPFRNPIARNCSEKFKVVPIRQWSQDSYGESFRTLIGYEAEEERRVKKARMHQAARLIDPVFPLVDLGWSRAAMSAWLLNHDLPLPPKSACTHCPFQSLAEAMELAREHPDMMARNIRIEEAVQRAHPLRHDCTFLADRQRKPLPFRLVREMALAFQQPALSLEAPTV